MKNTRDSGSECNIIDDIIYGNIDKLDWSIDGSMCEATSTALARLVGKYISITLSTLVTPIIRPTAVHVTCLIWGVCLSVGMFEWGQCEIEVNSYVWDRDRCPRGTVALMGSIELCLVLYDCLIWASVQGDGSSSYARCHLKLTSWSGGLSPQFTALNIALCCLWLCSSISSWSHTAFHGRAPWQCLCLEISDLIPYWPSDLPVRSAVMLIKEYRIPLPLTVEEYRIAQLYMIQVSQSLSWTH